MTSKHFFSLAPVCVVALLSSAPALAQSDDLGIRDWAVGATNSLPASPPSRADVVNFFQKHLPDAGGDGDICSFGFFDVAKDGMYRLLASIDYSGRHFCNTVVAITKNSSDFQIQQLVAWQVDEISDVVGDFNHDGKIVLAIPQPFSLYEGGTHCVATWTRLYLWRNGHLEDASGSFPQFYRERLRELTAATPEPSGLASPAKQDESESSCTLMEADKIRRALGMSPTAGFDRAVAWMESADRSLRREAISVFDDIGNKESLAKLDILARDADPYIAQSARNALQHATRR